MIIIRLCGFENPILDFLDGVSILHNLFVDAVVILHNLFLDAVWSRAVGVIAAAVLRPGLVEVCALMFELWLLEIFGKKGGCKGQEEDVDSDTYFASVFPPRLPFFCAVFLTTPFFGGAFALAVLARGVDGALVFPDEMLKGTSEPFSFAMARILTRRSEMARGVGASCELAVEKRN